MECHGWASRSAGSRRYLMIFDCKAFPSDGPCPWTLVGGGRTVNRQGRFLPLSRDREDVGEAGSRQHAKGGIVCVFGGTSSTMLHVGLDKS